MRGLDLTVSDHQNYFLPLGGLTFDHGSDPLENGEEFLPLFVFMFFLNRQLLI